MGGRNISFLTKIIIAGDRHDLITNFAVQAAEIVIFEPEYPAEFARNIQAIGITSRDANKDRHHIGYMPEL